MGNMDKRACMHTFLLLNSIVFVANLSNFLPKSSFIFILLAFDNLIFNSFIPTYMFSISQTGWVSVYLVTSQDTHTLKNMFGKRIKTNNIEKYISFLHICGTHKK